MASNMALVSSGQPNAGSLSLLPTLSAEILTQIFTTHAPSDIEKLDVESLFSIVNNVLNRATMTVDTVLQLQVYSTFILLMLYIYLYIYNGVGFRSWMSSFETA